jgi:hypothetical protein
MTTLPNTLTSTVNHERSPVPLTGEDEFSTWLTGTPKEAFGLIKTSDPNSMRIATRRILLPLATPGAWQIRGADLRGVRDLSYCRQVPAAGAGVWQSSRSC